MTASPDNDHASTPRRELDTACELLANATRRSVMQYFTAEETAVAELDELIDHIHEKVNDVTGPKQARTPLVHMHLPKLADAGVIEYDERSETIRYRDSDRLETFLEVVTADYDRTPTT
ncbi:helix-turn-helix domain-containing protein [Haladaptatus halobius]|uniref:helix-turn-helix domain-containing protein n=1 Tax=Haladaptatus halobius TaxID=2884875 RepID=UPI001D09ADC2|nr:helix-turn-helix domain-containing protein [Haladaptatus halobius]